MTGGPRREESEAQRWDRNFADLLQELRVTQAGVQILFAFLLTVAFMARFNADDVFQRSVYVVALLSAAAAAAMLIAPVAYHRALFRRGQKPQLVRSAHRMASGGLAFLLVSMVSAILLITDVVLDRVGAVVISSVAAAWFMLLWFVLPLASRNGGEQ